MQYKNSDIKYIKNLKDNFFLVTWRMTGWCNYHCPYCINSTLRNNFTKWKSEDEIIQIAKRINTVLDINKINKPLKLKLIGGEICYYNLPKVLDNISNISKLLITTNFSNSLDYYKNLYEYCKKRKINLVLILSYHEENLDFESKVVELTRWSETHSMSLPQVSYVITKDFDFSKLEYYQKNNIWKVKLVIEKNDSNYMVDLSDEQKEKLAYYNSYYNKLNLSKNISPMYEVGFKDGSIEQFSNIYNFINNLDEKGFVPDGYMCSAGSDMFTIGYDNNVYLNKCHYLEDVCLGSINDNIKLNRKVVQCHASSISGQSDCRCNLCSSISVWRSN